MLRLSKCLQGTHRYLSEHCLYNMCWHVVPEDNASERPGGSGGDPRAREYGPEVAVAGGKKRDEG